MKATRWSERVEEIGSAHGRIVLYLTKEDAIGLALCLPLHDTGYRELMDAVDRAYPDPEEDA